jgi:phosphoadenosine phosphosulfate reductase
VPFILYRELKPVISVPMVFLDTLHHFPETLELVTKAKEIYNLDLRTYRIPEIDTRAAFAARYGDALWD